MKGREAVRIFISWSGETSHEVAKILYDWLLKMQIPALELFISDEMDKGEKWSPVLETKLKTADGGIFCLTKENVNSPWLLFEAGALCVAREKPFMSPFLFRVSRSAVPEPLMQFQHTDFTRRDVKALVFRLKRPWNENDVSPDNLEADFERLYPELETKLQAIPQPDDFRNYPVDGNTAKILMDIRQRLDNILE